MFCAAQRAGTRRNACGPSDVTLLVSHVHRCPRRTAGGVRLAKEHKDSKRRIDAAVAAVMAHDRAAVLVGDRGPSIYV